MKIGVIIDETRIARWQAEALELLAEEAKFVVYSCRSAPRKRRLLRHAGYYSLNLFTVRNRLTRPVPLPGGLNIEARRSFDARCDGQWHSLPSELLEIIRRDRVELLIKFGMGLLRVPPADQLAVPILSYHHGDPARFRGRPAGFHELLQGEQRLGQIVQILSNRLDGGDIVAGAETRVIPHSYRATLIEAYRHSPLLLKPAIRAVLAGAASQPAQLGPAYRLPSNVTVLRFVARLAGRRASWLLYGLAREKRWRVATASLPDPDSLDALYGALADRSSWARIEIPRGYQFLADPFFHPQRGLIAEAMGSSSARGEILHLDDGKWSRVSGRGGHFSYPSVVESGGRSYVVPEVSDWSPALAFPLDGGVLGIPFELDIPNRPRLLDPTVFAHGNSLFLFANIAAEGASVLRLWVSDSIGGAFVEHPSSPILISPRGGRMAGSIATVGGRLIRMGQDQHRGYGDGISFFHVSRLDPETYAEQRVGSLRFPDVKGPHTLNLGRGEAAFDYYQDEFSPLAGLRRLRQRHSARRVFG